MHWLWLHLGNPVYEMKCAELICQLQNTLRLPDLVERCIGNYLAGFFQMLGFLKFIIVFVQTETTK